MIGENFVPSIFEHEDFGQVRRTKKPPDCSDDLSICNLVYVLL